MATDLQYNWALTDAINRIPKKTTFLQDVLFGGPEIQLPSSRLALDVFSGNTGMAPFVRRGHEAKRIDGRTKTMETLINIPEIKACIVKDIGYELDQHTAGVPITGPEGTSQVNPVPYQDAMAIEDLQNKIIERKEWMLSQMITGTLAYAAADLDFTISYNLAGAHNITAAGTDKWDDAACDPIAVMQEDYVPLIVRATGGTPDYVVMSPENAVYFLSRTAVQDKMKWIAGGGFNATGLNKGVDQYGCWEIGTFLGMKWVVYYGQFNADTTGTATNYIGATYIYIVRTGPHWKKFNCPIATSKGPVYQPIMVETYEKPLTTMKEYQATSHFIPVGTNMYNIVRVAVR